MPEKESSIENIEELLQQMPDEARQIFITMMMRTGTHEPLKIVKSWTDDFDVDCPIDAIIVHILQQVISGVGSGIVEDMKQAKDAGMNGYSGKEAADIAIIELKKITEKLEKSTEKFSNFSEVKH